MAMGQKPNRTPSEHPNPTTKVGSKMGGELTNQNGIPLNGFDHHSHIVLTGIHSTSLASAEPIGESAPRAPHGLRVIFIPGDKERAITIVLIGEMHQLHHLVRAREVDSFPKKNSDRVKWEWQRDRELPQKRRAPAC